MTVSKKIKNFMDQGSWIRKMFEEGAALKEKYGEESVYDLSLGNPVTEPPSEFFDELKRIADNPTPGMHRYMANAGYMETRAAVADQFRNDTKLNFTANQVLMTCGAGGALNVVLKTLLDPGDEVVIFAPYFVEYNFYVDNHGGICRVVPCDENFYPNLDVLNSTVNARTKVILVNSPNNPTGVVYRASIIRQLAEIIQMKEREYGVEIFIVSDEPYRKILFDGIQYPHVFHHHVRTIVATSHSKDLALPGERIGFIAVHPDYHQMNELMDGLTFCNRTLGFVNAPALMQHIVRRLQSVTIDVREYQAKRDFLYDNLTNLGYSVVLPQGAFYMFPKAPIADDVAFVSELQRHNVLVVPGRGFGLSGFFRISYCVNAHILSGALEGFKESIERFT